MREVQVFVDVVSPYSYFAFNRLVTQLSPIWAAHVRIDIQPVSLAGVMNLAQNTPPGRNPLKARWMTGDLKLLSKQYGIPFIQNGLPPNFPANTILAMRCLLALRMASHPAYLAIFHSLFVPY